MDAHDSGDFPRPDVPIWDVFEDATITQHALEDEWAGGLSEDYCERIVDFLLANFAEKWMQGKTAKMDSVADFLTESIDDHFEVEIPHAIALSLAKVLVTIYEECRAGTLVGVTHILGEERVKRLLTPVDQDKASAAEEEVKAAVTKAPEASASESTASGGAKEQMDAEASAKTEKAPDAKLAEPTEDDGWTTVTTTKKKGGKKKGKQME